ncbi:ATP-binding protein [Lysinibacillus agricola]|uniref:histidine kinase n=1 Tax=Lysinibacillus agricola TaxID=2590012 RepID=A0ABX7ALJ0_9BACI|nr:hypothetical protein AN161_23045 [Lysinibacillus sp. FJAT-14222]QQP10267.1 ATP-binding protein [Lysinibacillus agricola]
MNYHILVIEDDLEIQELIKQFIKQISPNMNLRTDRYLLEKAFKNIIHNAITYSPHGETILIVVTELPKENQIQIQLSSLKTRKYNNYLSHFIESRNRNTGRSELGLYIVKQIFESLSITYLMINTQNGVHFLVTIPKGRS